MEKLTELKVKAFDLIRLMEQHQAVLQQIQSKLQEIAKEIEQEESKEIKQEELKEKD
jgi:hypothetical protein